MAVLGVEVISRPVEIGRHDGDKLGPILPVVRFTHLDAGDFGNGIRFVGRLQKTCQEVLLLHRLRSELGIYAGGAEK